MAPTTIDEAEEEMVANAVVLSTVNTGTGRVGTGGRKGMGRGAGRGNTIHLVLDKVFALFPSPPAPATAQCCASWCLRRCSRLVICRKSRQPQVPVSPFADMTVFCPRRWRDGLLQLGSPHMTRI